MSAEANKAVVLQYFLESHNPPYNLDVVDETCTPAYSAQQKAWHRMEREAFPDKLFEIEDAIAEGDKVVLRWCFHGTHLADFWTPVGTLSAAGRQLTQTATVTYRLEHGKIAEEWSDVDWLTVVRQLGAEVKLPAHDSSASANVDGAEQ